MDNNLFNQQYGQYGLSVQRGGNGRLGIFDTGEFSGRSGFGEITNLAEFTSQFGDFGSAPVTTSQTAVGNQAYQNLVSGAVSGYQRLNEARQAEQEAAAFNQQLAGASPGQQINFGGQVYTIDETGAPRSVQGMANLAATQQSGMTEISPGMFVPTGSAAAQNPQGILAQNNVVPTTQMPTQTTTSQIPTVPGAGGTGYVNINGAYFNQGPSGYQAVSDPNTLRALQSGQIASTQQSGFGSGAIAAPQQTGTVAGLAQQAMGTNTAPSPFVKVAGAYFEQTPNGLAAISDPTTLRGLMNGTINYTTQGAVAGGADRFASQPAGVLPSTLAEAQTGFDIPVDELTTTDLGSSFTRNDVLARAGGMQNYLNQLQAIQAQEAQAQSDLDKLQISGLQGVANIRDQAIPMPLIGRQGALLEQQIAMQALPLEQRLKTLAQQKGNVLEAMQIATDLQKLTRPDVLSTRVTDNGDVIAVVQNPDGTVSTQVAGNTGERAGNDYQRTSIHVNSQGQREFIGVKADGTVDKIILDDTTGRNITGETGGTTNVTNVTNVSGGGEVANNAAEAITFMTNSMTDDQVAALKQKADDAGISKWYLPKSMDVKNYLNSIEAQIQASLDQGYSWEEILAYLIS